MYPKDVAAGNIDTATSSTVNAHCFGLLIPSPLQTNEELHVQATPHRGFQDFVVEHQWKVVVNSPEERQSDQPT